MLFRLLRHYVRETFSWQTLAFMLALVVMLTTIGGGIGPSSAGSPGEPARPDAGSGSGFGASSPLGFDPVRISVVDVDQGFISHAVMRQLESMPMIERVHADTLETARRRLADNEILLAMVFPAGFFGTVVNRVEPARLTVLLNERMPNEAAQFVRLLDSAAGSVAAVQAALAVFQREARPLLADDRAYARQVEAAALSMAFRMLDRVALVQVSPDRPLDTVRFVIAAMLCLFSVLPSLLVLLLALQERRSGLRERMIAANVSRPLLHLAKLLTGLFWLLAILLPLLALIGQLRPEARRAPMLLAAILLYLAAGLFCLILAERGQNPQTLMLAAWLGLLGALFAGGSLYPDALLPVPVRWLGLASPVHWAFRILYQASGRGTAALSRPFAMLIAMLAVGAVLLLAPIRRSPVRSR